MNRFDRIVAAVRRLGELHERAMKLAPEEREAFLARECADDSSMFAQAKAMLDGVDSPPSSDSLSIESAEPPVAPWDDCVAQLERHRPVEPRYVEVDELGRGGMGTVLRARDPDLRRDVAMKIIGRLDEEPARSPSGREAGVLGRFLDEAQVMAQLDHPAIPPVHELGVRADGRVFFTMKVVKGRDFRDVIEEYHAGSSEWTLPRLVGVVLRVCEAMAFAHSRGVIHRDLKPSNVMVGDFGEVYVMDWGLARVLVGEHGPERVTTGRSELARDESSGLHTLDGDVVGTPAYMPPEQALGRIEELGPRCDVYAAGAILYHVLAGASPYADRRASGARELLRLVQDGPPTPISMLAPRDTAELISITERAMQRDATARYATMSDLGADLRAWLEGRVVSAHRTGFATVVAKWMRRNPLTTGVATALVLAVLGGVIVERVRAMQVLVESARVFKLQAGDDLDRLERAAIGLWPLDGNVAPAQEAWLAEARELPRRLAEAREDLVRLEAMESRDEKDEWWLRNLRELLARGDRFFASDPSTGLFADVTRRLEVASSMRHRTIESQAVAWRAVSEFLASPVGVARYGSLRIDPIEGLIPLGTDPASGLLEFTHAASGEAPIRDASGTFVVTPSTSLILVLVPGGSFRMGAVESEANSEGAVVYPFASVYEVGGDRVTLDAYFISKYEVTQAQWGRIMGALPSAYDQPDRDLRPVENVSYLQAIEACRRWGLELSTEAQWEFAARAGSAAPWSPLAGESEILARLQAGDARFVELFRAGGNLCDSAYHDATGDASETVPWSDGFATTAPVGSYTANAFGLHDVMGNVWEWCRDGFAPLTTTVARPGDGLRSPGGAGSVTLRGGGWRSHLAEAAVVARFRNGLEQDYRDGDLGLRPVLNPKRSAD